MATRPAAVTAGTGAGDAGRPAGVSDAAVRAGTGKGWAEWFALLDAARGAEVGHKGIVAVLAAHPRVGPWWRQMVAVAYEQERGLRQRHQTPEGFQLSVSRTVAASAETVFGLWADGAERSGWLAEADLVIRKAVAPRSLRIAWSDGSAVEVAIHPRGPERSRVVVDHRRLRDAQRVGLMKEFWADALDALARRFERG